MDEKIGELMNHEIIVLSNLKDINKDLIYEYFDQNPYRDSYIFELSNEEKPRTEEEKKKILEMKNEFKKKSLELHYKINSQKIKELKLAFNQLELKAKFESKPKVLKDGILYTLSKAGFIMYDNKFLKKILEIKFKPTIIPFSAILLDNNDLVFACFIYDKDDLNNKYVLLIYRLKEKQYYLFQEIKEGGFGYLSRFGKRGFCSNTFNKIEYKVDYLKSISGNKFICVSNYGIKIYSLNGNNEYSLVLLNKHLNDIKIIYELNNNKFIFCTLKDTFMWDNTVLMELIELNKITKEELDDKLKNLEKYGYHLNTRNSGCYNFRIEIEDRKKIYKSQILKLIESLKLTCSFKEIIKYIENGRNLNSSNYIILKKKYFIVMINNNIFIINLIDSKFLKKYKILIDAINDGKDSLFIYDFMEIQKWNNSEDNEFVLFIDKNVILFELNDDEIDTINLKILCCSYFPNIADNQNFQKLSEKHNKFYSYDKNSSHIISIY